MLPSSKHSVCSEKSSLLGPERRVWDSPLFTVSGRSLVPKKNLTNHTDCRAVSPAGNGCVNPAPALSLKGFQPHILLQPPAFLPDLPPAPRPRPFPRACLISKASLLLSKENRPCFHPGLVILTLGFLSWYPLSLGRFDKKSVIPTQTNCPHLYWVFPFTSNTHQTLAQSGC